MKKFSMTLAGLITLAPAPIFAGQITSNIFLTMLIVILLCWVSVELFIGFTRPCQGTSPKLTLVKISRMIWPLFVIYSWLDFRYSWSTVAFPSWFMTLLIALCSAGLLIRIWAVAHLGKSFTYDVMRPNSGRLIKTGPYRFIRHPSYLGILILGSLPGLILGSIPGSIGMLLTTLAPVILRAKAEDELLEKEFGEDYIKYKNSIFSIFPFSYYHRRETMDKVRIHPNNFRNLFYIYHASGGIGFVLLVTYIFLLNFHNSSYVIMLVCGLLMIAIPLSTAPPEIIVNLEEQRIMFRKRLFSVSANFRYIHTINIIENVIEIADSCNKAMIVIRQQDFKNIPLYDLGNYISELISGNTDTNYTQYTSICFVKNKAAS